MEAREEAMAATITVTTTTTNSSSSTKSECSHAIVKGKRTKRQRLLQPSSASSSGEFSGSTTEEEEDMANCLILLAQGEALGAGQYKSEEEGGTGGGEKLSSRRLAEAATTANGKAGFYLYECKTCNKCFPSFQALGGHRSSHKKLKVAPLAMATDQKKREMDEGSLQQISTSLHPTNYTFPCNNTINSSATPAALNNTNSNSSNNQSMNGNKSRVHECSVCGSEFSSGQALGGHMRRHRAAIAMEPQEAKKEKGILSLDLNLPAPSDDDRGDFPKSPSFAFVGNQPLLFSASALVDCHY